MLVGLVVMTIHHVVSTEIVEKETKSVIYNLLVELQEEDYEAMTDMLQLDKMPHMTANDAKEYVQSTELDSLIGMDLNRYPTLIYSAGTTPECYVDFNYNQATYKFECIKTESGWKIASAKVRK